MLRTTLITQLGTVTAVRAPELRAAHAPELRAARAPELRAVHRMQRRNVARLLWSPCDGFKSNLRFPRLLQNITTKEINIHFILQAGKK